MRYLNIFFALSFVTNIAVALDNATQVQLETAKSEYTAAVDKAKTDLVAVFDSKIQEIAQKGNLENVKALISEKKDFVDDGKVPTSQTLKSATAEYQTSVKKAHDAMATAYANAVTTYTKSLEIDKADAVNSEFEAFKQSATLNSSKPAQVQVAAAAKPATGKPQIEYTYYSWESGNPPKKMIKKDEGFCYLVRIKNGANIKTAEIFISNDDFWYLGGEPVRNTEPLQLWAVAVKINTVAPVTMKP